MTTRQVVFNILNKIDLVHPKDGNNLSINIPSIITNRSADNAFFYFKEIDQLLDITSHNKY